MPDFIEIFAQNGLKQTISDDQWKSGWSGIVGGDNGVPTSEQFNTFGYNLDGKINTVKSLLDTLSNSMQMKAPCRVSTTGNITLSGLQIIDGVAVIAGDSVLVKNQDTVALNGIYIVSSDTWNRRSDANAAPQILGMCVMVLEGTVNSGTGWFLSTPGPITLGTSALNFLRIPVFSSASGLKLPGALYQPYCQTIASVSGVLALTEGANLFIANGTENITSITWTGVGLVVVCWNTSRALVHSASLILKNNGGNRITSQGDAGLYLINGNVATELFYNPAAGYPDYSSSVDPLVTQTMTYNDKGQLVTAVIGSMTYQIAYNADGTLNTISNGIKTMQVKYNEWGQFIGTVIL